MGSVLLGISVHTGNSFSYEFSHEPLISTGFVSLLPKAQVQYPDKTKRHCCSPISYSGMGVTFKKADLLWKPCVLPWSWFELSKTAFTSSYPQSYSLVWIMLQ